MSGEPCQAIGRRCPHGFLGRLCVVETCSHWDGLKGNECATYRYEGDRRQRLREAAKRRYRQRRAP